MILISKYRRLGKKFIGYLCSNSAFEDKKNAILSTLIFVLLFIVVIVVSTKHEV